MDWNNTGAKDLLVGAGAGGVYIYQNIGTNPDNTPLFDNGTRILAGPQTGERAAPVMMDWDGNGTQDLLVGNLDGFIKIYKNDGLNNFIFDSNLKVGGLDFDIGSRAAPRLYDWNGDGLMDILSGEVYGYIYYLQNRGTNTSPLFNSAERLLLADGNPLRYISTWSSGGPRSRLDIADWNGDGYSDLLVGGADGRVMLFTAAPEPMSTTLFFVGSGVLGLCRLRKKFKDRNN